MSSTPPSVDETVAKTQSLTQVAKPVFLYDQDLSLGLIMRPVKRVIDTTKIAELFGGARNSVKPVSQPKKPDETAGSQEAPPVDANDPLSGKRTEQGLVGLESLLRASLISEAAIRGTENRTQEEYGPLISMPLPEKIKDSLRVNYSSADLGMAAVGAVFGQNVANPNRDGGSLADSLVGSASYVVRTLLASLPGGIGDLSQKLSGSIPNPFSAAIFEKVTPRKFSFNWTIQPQTPEESANLKDIINHLRYWSLPNPSKQRLILDVPYEWELSFVGTGFLYSFSRCVMSNLDIDYSPNGFNAFMADGAPQAVTILVEFEEIFPLDKSTIDEAGPGATSMKPSGILETRPDEPTDEQRQKAIEQQNALAVAASETKLVQARSLRTTTEKNYESAAKIALENPKALVSDPVKPTERVDGVSVRNFTTAENAANYYKKQYDSAYQNEVSAYNEYSSAIQQFKTDTGKQPTQNVLSESAPQKP